MNPKSSIRTHFLGTNGWYDTDTGNTICILVDCPEYGIILDAGNGIHKLDSVVGLDKPFYLLLSHLHLDHICGLHILSKFRFKHPLKIFTPTDQRPFLERFLSRPYTIDFKKLPYGVELYELPRDSQELPCEAGVFELEHGVPTIAVRLQIGDKIITYCPDTGLCESAVAAARGADLLMAECAYLPGEVHEEWPHLNPESAAQLAREAGAKDLILVHFDASRYDTMEKRKNALNCAQRIFPKTAIANDDDLRIILI